MAESRTNGRKTGAVLVVGGGVAGMRAAADLAEAGLKVYLVEAAAGLGGRVSQLGFMFPTHDCVLCRGSSDHGYGCTRPSISPAFQDHNLHPNIELRTLTEVVDFRGQLGEFTVRLRRNPRHVDPARCINCRLCSVVCPANLPSEFQLGMSLRKAAYKASPRSIPDAYLVERGPWCDGCGKCAKVCPTGAIDLDEKPRAETIRVGAAILALGYRLFDPTVLGEFGFGRYRNVVTSRQFERLASRSGPTEGVVARLSDGKKPKKIAWLQCIGSRDQEHPYCSSICCMIATKQAMLAKQRNGETECRVFVMDERAFNKEYTRYYNRALETHGVRYTRCRVSAIREEPGTQDLLLRYPDEVGRLREEAFGMVVLAVGMEPPARSAELARLMRIELNPHGFCQTDKFQPLQTSQPGVYVAGAFQSPKEIAETVFDAAGAAGEVMRVFHDALGGLPAPREYPFLGLSDGVGPERDVTGEPARVAVLLCQCGPVIAQSRDLDAVAAYARSLPGVVSAATVPLACFPEGLAAIREVLADPDLHPNRVVVGACSPRTHEALLQRVVREAGLNPYLLEVANLREYCAWVHDRQPAEGTRKAQELVRLAVLRAARLLPIRRMPIQPRRSALVLGGGVAGMTTALTIADSGFDVTLVERSESLGGNLRHIYYLAEGMNPQRLLRDLVNRVRGHHRSDVRTRTELAAWGGSIGRFRTRLRSLSADLPAGEPEHELEHGVLVVATGGREGTPQASLAQGEGVVTQLELEDWIAHQPERIAGLDKVVMVQCVQPREADHFYCSRTCCTNTMKNAIRVKMLNPSCAVTVLYKDIITYGFREQYYTEARRRGVVFVRYSDEEPPELQHGPGGELRLEVRDPALDRRYTLDPDLVVLSLSLVPSDGTAELAGLLGLPISSEGFFLEVDLKMRPMDFLSEGVFLCGLAHYPRFVDEVISSAQAAAGRALTILSMDPFYVGGVVADVDADRCVGCLTCVRTCPFRSPRIVRDRSGVGGLGGHAWIDPALCQGCGTCTAECPAAAIQLAHFRDEQVRTGALGAWGRG
ncbi:MAG: CoB--CoM heterodisulfide reductase iron-sulfur subunit A family protein [Deltaproteobacteria bacterium]|nr:CoB--CoM heterodisulfide reductase iron-sulfur subunit A family protein [Deltaproteobacteria bacterium]